MTLSAKPSAESRCSDSGPANGDDDEQRFLPVGRRGLRPESGHHLGRLSEPGSNSTVSPSTTLSTPTTNGRWKHLPRWFMRHGTRRWRGCDRQRIARHMGQRAQALCMRDTDRDLVSVIVTRDNGPCARSTSCADGVWRRVLRFAAGRADSAPSSGAAGSGARPRFRTGLLRPVSGQTWRPHRRRARRGARTHARRVRRRVPHRRQYLLFAQEGTLPSGSVRTLATTPAYDHCNFTVLEGCMTGPVERFVNCCSVCPMKIPQVRRLLDLEGLKRWLPGRAEGYRLLDDGGGPHRISRSVHEHCGRAMRVDLGDLAFSTAEPCW